MYESIINTECINQQPEYIKYLSDFQKGGSIFSDYMKTGPVCFIYEQNI